MDAYFTRKIKPLATLIQELPWRKVRTIVFTNGCFRVLTYAHCKYLQECSEQGGFLIVGLNSDRSVKELKGDSIQTEDQRAYALASLSCVGAVIIFDENTPEEVIKAIRPDVLIKGGNYVGEIVGAEFVKSCGGKVMLTSKVDGISTSEVLKKLEK